MKTLEPTFTSNGFVHELVQREGNHAIYRRFKQGGGQEHFETIRIRSHNGFQIGTMKEKSEPAEIYPGNEKWGTDGWTYPDITSARERLATLLCDEQKGAEK